MAAGTAATADAAARAAFALSKLESGAGLTEVTTEGARGGSGIAAVTCGARTVSRSDSASGSSQGRNGAGDIGGHSGDGEAGGGTCVIWGSGGEGGSGYANPRYGSKNHRDDGRHRSRSKAPARTTGDCPHDPDRDSCFGSGGSGGHRSARPE